jgi:hypothetical protein
MLNVVKQGLRWLDWKIVVGISAVLGAVAVCTQSPLLSILAGVAPIVLLAACLIPCLLPLAWLRSIRRTVRATPAMAETDTHRVGRSR